MKYAFFVLAISAALAACSDNAAGVGAGSSSSSTSDTNSVLSKSKAITAADESAKSIQMPAIAIIAEAFAERVPGHSGDNSRMQDAQQGSPEGFEELRKVSENLFDLMKKNPAEFDAKVKPSVTDRLYSQFKEAQSSKEFADALVRYRLERRITSCSSPMNGWEYNPMNKDSKIYMQAVANACDFTNLIFTELAGKIGNRALSNPAEATEDVLKNWDALPLADLEETWKSVVQKNKNSQFSANLTGVKGVQFMGEGGMYWNQGSGFVVAKNSAKWFGDGAISGKVVDFNLRSSLGTKTEKSKSQSSSQGQQSGSKTGADIGVK